MKTKVLHLVGGSLTDGAYKGANILHEALLELNVDSKILNDSPQSIKQGSLKGFDENIIYINDNFYTKLLNKTFIFFEKVLKYIYLDSPRSTFTLGFFGFDITKLKAYKEVEVKRKFKS